MAIKQRILGVVVAAPLLAFSSGCANGPKAAQGALSGAMAGAIVGAQVAGPRGALVGALMGGFVGNSIGAHLDEEDKRKMAELEVVALKSGRSQSFTARKSGAAVTVTPEAETQEVVRTLTLSPNITAYQLQQVEEIKVLAHVDTPVYPSASTRQQPRLVLKKGSDLHVSAGLKGQSGWGAVVEGSTIIGYVPNTYLEQRTARTYVAPVSRRKEAKVNLQNAAVEKPVQPSPAVEPPVRSAEVVGDCKVLVRKVKLADQSEPISENAKYCKEPPKGWKAVST